MVKAIVNENMLNKSIDKRRKKRRKTRKKLGTTKTSEDTVWYYFAGKRTEGVIKMGIMTAFDSLLLKITVNIFE